LGQRGSAGYNFLWEEYLRQQQQAATQEEYAVAAAYDSCLTNLSGMQGSNEQMNRSFTTLGTNANAMGLIGNMNGLHNYGNPPSIIGTQISSASDLSLSEHMFPQTRQGGPNILFSGAVSAAAQEHQGIMGLWSERAAGLLGNMVSADPSGSSKKAKRVRQKQPKDKPKRPLSAYNIFFKEERVQLLATASGGKAPRTINGKIGFENLAKLIGGKWQGLKPSEVEYYKEKAGVDMQRYKEEMEAYKRKLAAKVAGSDEEDKNEDEDTEQATKRQRLE
jgi:hypothetical protein